jgi:hypothetical protein
MPGNFQFSTCKRQQVALIPTPVSMEMVSVSVHTPASPARFTQYARLVPNVLIVGNEWIRITCTTDTTLLMKVRACLGHLATLRTLSCTNTYTHMRTSLHVSHANTHACSF